MGRRIWTNAMVARDCDCDFMCDFMEEASGCNMACRGQLEAIWNLPPIPDGWNRRAWFKVSKRKLSEDAILVSGLVYGDGCLVDYILLNEEVIALYGALTKDVVDILGENYNGPFYAELWYEDVRDDVSGS